MKKSLVFAVLLASLRLLASPMDLSRIQCEFPWEEYTTESNTTGIMFDDNGNGSKPFFLDMTNIPPVNATVEMKFTMKNILGADRASGVGLQLWEGLEKFGKDRSLTGHYLVLFNSDGNLDVKLWNGRYYSIIKHKTRFRFFPGKPQSLKVDLNKAGSLRVYVNSKLQMSVRVKKLKVNAVTPVRLCAFPGTWMEMTSFEVRH